MSFNFDFTVEKLAHCCPYNKDSNSLLDALCQKLPGGDIVTKPRVAMFLAQCGHESNDFTVLKENLNYGAQGLANTWPTRFAVLGADGRPVKPYVPTSFALEIERNPELIANAAYSDRMGNGDFISGDGWRYRGRGAIQLTGKSNYELFAQARGMALEDVAEYLDTLAGAIDSAVWYWTTNNLNAASDDNDVLTATKRINGGTNGLDDRQMRYTRAMAVL